MVSGKIEINANSVQFKFKLPVWTEHGNKWVGCQRKGPCQSEDYKNFLLPCPLFLLPYYLHLLHCCLKGQFIILLFFLWLFYYKNSLILWSPAPKVRNMFLWLRLSMPLDGCLSHSVSVLITNWHQVNLTEWSLMLEMCKPTLSP